MLDTFEADAGIQAGTEVASEPAVLEAPCACGSGLAAWACCSLDLRGAQPAEPTPRTQAQLDALTEARRLGDQAAATDLSIAILTNQPTLLEALAMLFLIRKDQDNRPAALALIRRASSLAPKDIRFTKYLVDSLVEDKAWVEAEATARQAVRLNPGDPIAQESFGQVLSLLYKLPIGEIHLRRAPALTEAPSLGLLMHLAVNLRSQGRFDAARAFFEQARALAPGAGHVSMALIETERLAGAPDRAAELIEAVEAKIRPSAQMTRLKARVTFDQGRFAEALTVLEAGFPSAESLEAEDHYLRGQTLDKLGRYEEAFAAFETANGCHTNIEGGAFTLETPRRLAQGARAFVGGEGDNRLPTAPPAPGIQPLFVVGFPRSGTTMLEQSLSMHPDVVAGGELSSLPDVAAASRRLLGSPMPYPFSLSELWMGDQQDQIGLLRDHYLNSARRALLDPAGAWFTDKALTNELHLGLAHMLFPKSPIIHIVRHPLDVVVSGYANSLPHGGYSGGFQEVAEYYLTLLETAEYFRASNPDLNYMRVRYEDILEDQEGWTRRILDFAGLPFDEACLRFHENQRYARTVSHRQVREKINTRSKARYRNYLKHLGPAIEALEPAIARLGYSV